MARKDLAFVIERIVFWAMIAAIMGVLLIVFHTARVSAHSFYPLECCSDRDCWPMGDHADAKEPEPQATPHGWRLHDGTVIAFSAARLSPDGRFHVCRQSGVLNGSVIRPEGRPVCLFTPSHGS